MRVNQHREVPRASPRSSTRGPACRIPAVRRVGIRFEYLIGICDLNIFSCHLTPAARRVAIRSLRSVRRAGTCIPRCKTLSSDNAFQEIAPTSPRGGLIPTHPYTPDQLFRTAGCFETLGQLGLDGQACSDVIRMRCISNKSIKDI